MCPAKQLRSLANSHSPQQKRKGARLGTVGAVVPGHRRLGFQILFVCGILT